MYLELDINRKKYTFIIKKDKYNEIDNLSYTMIVLL